MESAISDIFGTDLCPTIMMYIVKLKMSSIHKQLKMKIRKKPIHDELLKKEHILNPVMGIIEKNGIELTNYLSHFKKFAEKRDLHSGDIYGARHSNNSPWANAPAGVIGLDEQYPGKHNRMFVLYPYMYHMFGAKLEDLSLLKRRTNPRGYRIYRTVHDHKFLGNDYLRNALEKNGIKVKKRATRIELVRMLMKL
jgi:hypothetical protein